MDSDLEKAFQLWYELQGSQVRITAEHVKGTYVMYIAFYSPQYLFISNNFVKIHITNTATLMYVQ